jgi:hypothetical protein
MILYRTPRVRGLRLAPLAAAFVVACAGTANADMRLGVAMPAAWTPGNHSGVAAIFQALSASRKPAQPAVPTTTAVTSCADDGGAGTLRAVIATAADGDTLDLSALTCGVITLTQGAIPVQLNDLTLAGPGAERLAIDGAGADRVFVHYGYGTLRLSALTVRDGLSTVSGYKVAGGACILSGGYVTLDHATVSGCNTIGEGAYGGGILAYAITLYTSTLSGNVAQGSLLDTLTAAYGGGAFAYRGIARLYDSTVSGNRATIDPANTHGSYDTGGGIFADNGGLAVRSILAGNYTDGSGGGIASHAGFLVGNSTISGNIAKTKSGGGIFVRLNSAMTVNNSTITQNQAVNGGGIYIAGTQPFDLQSTIVGGNVASGGAADLATESPRVITGANNLVISTSAGTTLPGDTLHSDPLLLPLADNGGPTLTHALAPASPARDTGNNAANLNTDQRGAGHPRVAGMAADIGAFEAGIAVQAAPLAVPALSIWTIGMLAGLLAWLGLRQVRADARRGSA